MLKLSAAPLVLSVAMVSAPAHAQDAADDEGEATIVVTGSRIARPNLDSNSPVAVVSGDATVENADVTLDTFLNTLPQVNPAARPRRTTPATAASRTSTFAASVRTVTSF